MRRIPILPPEPIRLGLVAERALLERRLEEAHLHLSEIKTSWSTKIAILETQVSRAPYLEISVPSEIGMTW